jgi:DNA-binding transcriptional regulator YiaG
MGKTGYAAEVLHDDRLHSFTIPELELPICRSCREEVFTEDADLQIGAALRSHLNLLTPEQMRTAIERVGMSQKEVAERLGIGEEALSGWLDERMIQSRAMDNLLRAFFAFPNVRIALSGPNQDSRLGIGDAMAAKRNGTGPAPETQPRRRILRRRDDPTNRPENSP